MAMLDHLKAELTKKIETENATKQETLKQQLEESKAKQVAQYDKVASEKKRAIATKAETKIKNKKLALTNDLRNRQLKNREELLQQLFDEALQKLEEMDAPQFNLFVEKAVKQIPNGDITIAIGEKSQNYFEDVQTKVSNLNQNGYAITLSDQYVKNASGFILKQGGIDYNFTFKEVLQQIQPRLTSELMKRLFLS